MYNLALIGKNISHSKSGEMYKGLLGDKLSSYNLLDYECEVQIPTLDELFSKYDGISITSPYKRFFVAKLQLDSFALKVGAVNCIRKKKGMYEGTNTDYYACADLLREFFNQVSPSEVIILGDGVMSHLIQLILNELKKDFTIYSRKKTKDFSQLSFGDKFNQVFIINTCSRDYIFSGDVNKNIYFWDLNYNFLSHKLRLEEKCNYLDGLSLLELQARYATEFWSGNLKI